jgi:hypothetical protein
MYIIQDVRLRLVLCALLLSTLGGACANPLARQYEYDEQTYLEVDGSATITIAASVPALVALRGLPLDPASDARESADDVRRVFEDAGCTVERVNRPWRRAGRRFVQVRLGVADITQAGACGALAWSAYDFARTETRLTYSQTVFESARVMPDDPGWTGDELVAFKLHLPSRVLFHNVRRLADNAPGEVERGNILTWEQRFDDRLNGVPVVMRVETDPDSILHQTMFLFVGAFLAAVAVLAAAIWLVVRRGRSRLRELGR